jgi:hypothetical protein
MPADSPEQPQDEERADRPEADEAVEAGTRSERSKSWWAIILVAALTGIGSQERTRK